ncbi:MAG: hypothetical protein ABIG96_00900 [Candidatus Micrarchaeota archaeon]
MKLRGQSALEYLVTYGWAILAIVIIAAVLWYTGVFNPSKFRGGNECGGFGAFTCIDQVVVDSATAGADSGTMVLGNSLGRSITLSAGDILGTGAPVAADCDAWGDDAGTSRSVSATGKVYIICANAADLLPDISTGDSYDWTVSITYTDGQSGLIKTDSGGFLRGKVG